MSDLCPECRNGKHVNCTREALSEGDELVPCECECRDPDEVCPNGCERYGDWWVPEDCPKHLGGAA